MSQNGATALPPGPRMSRAVQTAIWSRQAQWMLRQCRARFGDTFTIRIAYEGTWVMLSRSRGGEAGLHRRPRGPPRGRGEPDPAAPSSARNSLLLLDEAAHLEQRKLLLPPFHGKRMMRYGELMAEIAGAEIERWPLGEPYRLRPRMQAITLEIILRAVFGVSEGERHDELTRELRNLLDMGTDPRRVIFLLALGPERIRRFGSFQRDIERVDRLIYEEIRDRRRASDLGEREDILSLMLQAEHEDGVADDRPRAPRPARDPARRRPRDDRDRPVVGDRAPDPPSGEARAAHRRGPRRRRPLPEGGCDRDASPAARPRPRRPPSHPADGGSGAGRCPRASPSPPASTSSTADPTSTRSPTGSCPSASSRSRPAPTPGSRSAAASAAASAAPFAQYEMEVVLRELISRRDLRAARGRPERVFRRGITETPRHNAEVVLA